jgi:hypothetical protein
VNDGHNDVLLRALNRKGVIVELHVSRWRGTARASAEDLGLEISEDAKKRLALGRLRLLDEEDLQPLAQAEGRARHELLRFSTAFPLGGHFVALQAIPTLDRKLRDVEADFTNEVELLLEIYEERRDRMMERWAAYAEEVFDGSPEANDAFLQRIEAAYPSRAELRKKFRLVWTMHHVALPEQLDFALLEAEEAEAMQRLQERKRQVAREEIEQFAGQQAVAVRQLLAEVAKHVLSAVRDKDKVTARQLDMLRRKLDLIPLLQISADQGLERRVEELKAMLGDGASKDVAKELNSSEAGRGDLAGTLHAIGQEFAADADGIRQSARDYLATYARSFQ